MHGGTGETQATKNFHNESSEKAQKHTFHTLYTEPSCWDKLSDVYSSDVYSSIALLEWQKEI